MENWHGKVAVVTGASSGIGAAIAESLVQNGMMVAGLARREERLKELEDKLTGQKGQFYAVKADLKSEGDILSAFQWVEKHLGGIHVLVNNAGVANPGLLSDTSTERMKEVYDVNVIALQICCREGLKSMKAHNIDDGYIINITSIVAHFSQPRERTGTYYASKKAANAIGTALREELGAIGSQIRVTTISPGVTDTEILSLAGITLPKYLIDLILKPSDIADAVLYVLQLKQHILVTDLLIQTTVNMRKIFAKLSEERNEKK